eukprot:9173334-Alexandrium_andersonii.AAC.1
MAQAELVQEAPRADAEEPELGRDFPSPPPGCALDYDIDSEGNWVERSRSPIDWPDEGPDDLS